MNHKNMIICSIMILSLCKALYAMPKQDINELLLGTEPIITTEIGDKIPYNLEDLLSAIANNNLDDVKKILPSFDINKRFYDNDTFLMFAITRDVSEDIITLLLDSGADVNLKDNDGWTALMCAARYANKNIVNLLLNRKAIVNTHNNGGKTPLILATLSGKKDIVNLLIKNGADINAQDVAGSKALTYAVMKGYKEIASLLLKNGADVNTKYGYFNETVLMIATKHGYKDIVNLLVENKANLNIKNRNGKTALMIAKENGNKEIVSILQTAKRKANQEKIKELEKQFLESIISIGQTDK